MGEDKPKFMPYNKKHKKQARWLRTHSTKGEVYLWNRLKQHNTGYKFVRQKCIGNYIADFYCSEQKLVIEVDGHSHFNEKAEAHDIDKQAYLQTLGLRVLRIAEKDILVQADFVAQQIYLWLQENNLQT